MFISGDTVDGVCQLVVKLVLGVLCGRECRCKHADEVDRSCGGVDSKSKESFGAVAAWFYCIHQAVSHCKAHSVLVWIVRLFLLSEECVALNLQRSRVNQTCFLQSGDVHTPPFELGIDDGSFLEGADILWGGVLREAGQHSPVVPAAKFQG